MRGAPSIKDVILLAFSSVTDTPMKPVERCGRRDLRAVQGPVGNASSAFSMGPARSIGRFAAGPHAFALGPRRVLGSRIVGPFRVSRCA